MEWLLLALGAGAIVWLVSQPHPQSPLTAVPQPLPQGGLKPPLQNPRITVPIPAQANPTVANPTPASEPSGFDASAMSQWFGSDGWPIPQVATAADIASAPLQVLETMMLVRLGYIQNTADAISGAGASAAWANGTAQFSRDYGMITVPTDPSQMNDYYYQVYLKIATQYQLMFSGSLRSD